MAREDYLLGLLVKFGVRIQRNDISILRADLFTEPNSQLAVFIISIGSDVVLANIVPHKYLLHLAA